jgi:hypothetical protein
MTVNQLAFLAYAALIRGSIAFGLILKMDSDFMGLGFDVFTLEEIKVIKSTTSALVIITTIVFGAFTNFAQVVLLPKNKVIEDDAIETFLTEDKQAHEPFFNEDIPKENKFSLNAYTDVDGKMQIDEDSTLSKVYL